jgi:hypothetical protein
LNVGVSIKNIGNYLKSSISRANPENLKSFNSLNIKTNPKTNSSTATSNGNGILTDSNKVRNSANLQHRHSNPTGTSHVTHPHSAVSSAKSRVLQQNSNSLSDNPANALPRIRINS